MKIALIQNEVLANVQDNMAHVTSLLDSIHEPVDLIVLPELWNTPYENKKIKEAAGFDQKCLQFLCEQAQKKGCWIIGGTIPYHEGQKIYNRLFVIDEKGQVVTHYDKMHLMEVHTGKSSYAEADVFSAGDTFGIADTPWGKIGLLICFDVRFCEPARILASQGALLLIIPSAFNKVIGQKHWQMLMRVRAMENEVFVVGCNPAAYRYGRYEGYGHSLIAKPDGSILHMLDEKEQVICLEIDLKEIETVRQRSPYWKIRREDLYECKTDCL